MRQVCLLLMLSGLVAGLAGCGGGKGNEPTGSYSVSPGSLHFYGKTGASTPPQILQVQILSGQVYIGVEYDEEIIESAPLEITGEKTGKITVTPVYPDYLGAGVHQGSVTVKGCQDAFCSLGQVEGSPKLVEVTYTIKSLQASPDSLKFDLGLGGKSEPQTVQIQASGGGSYPWQAAVEYTHGSDWLTLDRSSGGSLPATFSVDVVPQAELVDWWAFIVVSSEVGAARIFVTYSVRKALSVAPETIELGHPLGGAPPALQTIQISDALGGSYPWTLSMSFGDCVTPDWLTPDSTGDASLPAAVNLEVVPLAQPDFCQAIVNVNGGVQASRSVQVTYSIWPPGIEQPAQMAFAAVKGQSTPPAAAQVVLATEEGLSVPYTTAVAYGAGCVSGWLDVTATGTAPGPLALAVNTTDLEVDTCTAEVSLRPDNGAAVVKLAVTYTLRAPDLTVDPGSVTFLINAGTTGVDLQRLITLGDAGTGLDWQARPLGVAWLALAPDSGNTAAQNQIVLNVIGPELRIQENGNYSVIVELAYTDPATSDSIVVGLPVELLRNLPQVDFVTPDAASAGQAGQVVIRGKGYAALAGQTLWFGVYPAQAYQVIGDTEIRATFPALPAGSHDVYLEDGLGINRTRATLTSATTPAFTTAVIPSAGYKTRLVYDATRLALLLANAGAARVERYSYQPSTGVWTAAGSRDLTSLRDVALAPGGETVVAVTDDTIHYLDPVGLGLIRQLTPSLGSDFYYLTGIRFGNDGRALLSSRFKGSGSTPLYLYDTGDDSVTSSVLLPGWDAYYSSARMESAADGSRIVIGQDYLRQVLYYDAGTGGLVETGLQLEYPLPLAVGTSAARSAIRETYHPNMTHGVYDQGFSRLGKLADTTLAAVFSPDQTFVYAFVREGNGSESIFGYDLAGATDPNGYYNPAATIALPASPGVDTSTRMATTPDGRTLFLAGDTNLVVVPVP